MHLKNDNLLKAEIPFIYLYVFKWPFDYPKVSLCLERREYLEHLRKAEPLSVDDSTTIWRLLSKAVLELFGKSINRFSPHRLETGRWVFDGINVSLSHSGGLYAVAISNEMIGIDIQKIRDSQTIREESTWSKAELEIINKIKNRAYAYVYWTRKEALYKYLDPGVNYDKNTRHQFDTIQYTACFRTWELSNHFLSICSNIISNKKEYIFDLTTNLDVEEIKEIYK